MGLPVQSTPQQIQARIVTGYNSGAQKAANAGPFSSLGPIFNAWTTEAIDLQQQIAYAAAITRCATSVSPIPGVNSPDVASFWAPFGYTPDPAVASSGTVTFGSPSVATSQLPIYSGTIIQTVFGTQYTVLADPTQSGWNAGLGAYVISVGDQYVNATVICTVAGSLGNAVAGAITQIVSTTGAPAPGGVSSVTNALAFTNGDDAESDLDFIARAEAGMSGKWGVPDGVVSAVDGMQTGLTYCIGDMLDPYGNCKRNFFTVFVNLAGQNSGPTDDLLASVQAIMPASRSLGMPYVVLGPTLVTVAVSATLTLVAGASSSAVISAANAALATYLNGIGMVNAWVNTTSAAEMTAQYSEIIVLLRQLTGVTNVTNVLVNGATSDITAGYGEQIVCGNLTLTTT